MNIAMIAEMGAMADPERVAVECGEQTLTYEQLLVTALRSGHWLSEQSVQTVGYLGENSTTWPAALFGAAAAGIPFCPLNYRWSAAELKRALGRIAPAVVIATPTQYEVARVAAAGLDGVTALSQAQFKAQAAAAEPLAAAETDPDRPAVLLFTSGTSGDPKMAVLRHDNLCSYIFSSVDFQSAEPGDAQLTSVPPYHVSGVANLLSCLYAGRRIVQLASFDASRWIEVAAAAKVTHAMLVPTMLTRILAVLRESPELTPPRLRHLSYGGGRMPLPVIREAVLRFPQVGFVNGYGLTETSSSITILTPEDHRLAIGSDDEHRATRLASVGRALPGVELEIRSESGARLPAGEQGEVWVRGPQVSGEYVGVGPPRDADGWFRTKDAGYLDGDGYLFITGRLDDVIVRGGENISPGEVEDVLMRHPDVAAAAVVGLPDTEWGEMVAAAVIPTEGAEIDTDGLREFVRKHLRSAKTPSVVAVVQELPYTDTGKLLRRKLKESVLAASKSDLESEDGAAARDSATAR